MNCEELVRGVYLDATALHTTRHWVIGIYWVGERSRHWKPLSDWMPDEDSAWANAWAAIQQHVAEVLE